MPKQYPPNRKLEALELLAIYDNVSTVQRLTEIPSSTLHRWRREESAKDADLSGKKDFPIAEKNAQTTHLSHNPSHLPPILPETTIVNAGSTQDSHTSFDDVPSDISPAESPAEAENANLEQLADVEDSEAASIKYSSEREEPLRGVPGKTYPYPLEEDQDPNSRFEEFRELRDMLLDHARDLAVHLKPTDPDINLRSLALARILDRVQQLDELLPDLNPDTVMRFEYVYDGMVHNVPPWTGAATQEAMDEMWRDYEKEVNS